MSSGFWTPDRVPMAVLPRQGLGSLTAGLDALDLVAVHDQLVLLADLHVMLEAAVHSVVPGHFVAENL